MALLGWHPESDEEVFNLKELTEKFSLKRVRPSGAIFNLQKLDWFNKQHLKRADKERIARLSADFLEAEGFLEEKGENKLYLPKRDLEVRWRWLEKVVELEQKRVKKLGELPRLVDFFFLSSIEYDPQLLVWKDYSQKKIREALKRAGGILKQISATDFKREFLEEKLIEEANTYDDRGLFLWPLRVALTGKEGSPGPFAVAGLLGKEESEKRVKKAIEKLS
jgi:glutamyl/glutaminyl-tRNA synthetase